MIRSQADLTESACVEWDGAIHLGTGRYFQDLNLERALRSRFPDDPVVWVSGLLLDVLDTGRVAYEKIPLGEDDRDEALLFACAHRLLIPGTVGGSAWKRACPRLAAGEWYAMPGVVAAMVDYARDAGQWNPESAMLRHLARSGGYRTSGWLTILRFLRERAGDGRITASLLRRFLMDLGSTAAIGEVIIGLLGVGLITPCLDRAVSPREMVFQVHPCLWEVSADGTPDDGRIH